MTLSEDIVGDDARDTRLLRIMETEARNYLQSHSWVVEVRQSFWGCGIGGIVAVFLLEIEPNQADVDSWLWVIVGDLPHAYLVTDHAPDPAHALEAYIDLMWAWVEAVRNGDAREELFPVSAPATQEEAERLAKRLKVLRDLDVCGIRSRVN